MSRSVADKCNPVHEGCAGAGRGLTRSAIFLTCSWPRSVHPREHHGVQGLVRGHAVLGPPGWPATTPHIDTVTW